MGFLSLGLFAQQDAGFSMYSFNPVYINPAYAGSREAFSGALTHRSQWIGMDDAPTTQYLSLHSPILYTGIGLGLQVYNDKAGPMDNTGINLTFAYHLPINETTKLSLGMTGMMNHIRVGWNQINFDDDNDQVFLENASSNWVPDASIGLYLYKPRFYAGISANHLLQSRFGFSETEDADLSIFYRQYYLTSGIVIPISKIIDLKPSILVKYVKSAPIVSQIDAAFIFNQKFLIGVGFRTDKKIDIKGMDSMILGTIEIEITRFLRVGYAYDYYMNRTGGYNSGTHEILLGWDIGYTKTKMLSPRFF